MTEKDPEARELRLCAAIVTAVGWGAGCRTQAALAATVGVSAGQLSRALRQETEPSLHMVTAFQDRFPLVPLSLLVRPVGDPLLELRLDELAVT